MSAFALVECDAADCVVKSDLGAATIQEARAWAKTVGWVKTAAGQDLCPAHRPVKPGHERLELQPISRYRAAGRRPR